MYKEPSQEDLESVQITDAGTFTFQLPKTKVNIEGRFISGHDEDRLLNAAQIKKKNKLLDTQTTVLLRAIIVSANGVTGSYRTFRVHKQYASGRFQSTKRRLR